MRQGRGSLYLLTGLLIGVILGLAYAWLVHPVHRGKVTPEVMRQEDKDRYRSLIAIAFLSEGDLVRARARLETLGESDSNQSLLDQAQRLETQGNATEEVRALLTLVKALNQGSDARSPSTPDG